MVSRVNRAGTRGVAEGGVRTMRKVLSVPHECLPCRAVQSSFPVVFKKPDILERGGRGAKPHGLGKKADASSGRGAVQSTTTRARGKEKESKNKIKIFILASTTLGRRTSEFEVAGEAIQRGHTCNAHMACRYGAALPTPHPPCG